MSANLKESFKRFIVFETFPTVITALLARLDALPDALAEVVIDALSDADRTRFTQALMSDDLVNFAETHVAEMASKLTELLVEHEANLPAQPA